MSAKVRWLTGGRNDDDEEEEEEKVFGAVFGNTSQSQAGVGSSACWLWCLPCCCF